MNAIEVKELKKTFGGFQALCGLSLEIPRGSFFGLIGPNGAGKTTLVKTLLGVVRPSEGAVKILGGSPEEPQIRARIGYLPERLHFAPGTTATSFLSGVARLRRLARPAQEVQRQLSRVGLAADSGRRVSGFSKGMKQRLGLACALLGEPDLLILDEPTDGIDPLGRAEVRQILEEEKVRGATILMNSHLLSETERSCDDIGILVRGRIAMGGNIDALCRDRSRWVLKFSQSSPADRLRALGFTPGAKGDVWVVAAEDEAALNQLISKAHEEGALLVGLAPYTKSLEDILKEIVEQGA